MTLSVRTAVFGSAAFLFSHSVAFAGQTGPAPQPNAMAVPEQVIITASPFAQNPLDVAASVAQVTHQDLLSTGGFGIGDALTNLPGLASTGFSSGSNRPVIRGLSSTRVKVTENSIGGRDTADVGDDHAVPIDALASLRVEVLRGPATLRYGSQAIGGVVNAINNRIPINLQEGATVEGFGTLSSNGVERVGGGIGDYRSGNWAVHGDALFRGADAYDGGGGDEQINSFAFGRGYALGGAFIGNDNSAAGLGFNQYIAHYGQPFDPSGTDKGHTYLDTKNYNGAGRLNAPIPGITSVNLQGGYTDYFHDEVSDEEGPVAHFMNREWEGRVEVLHDPFGPITTGALGVQYGHRNFGVSGIESDYLHPTKTNSVGLYIFEDFAITDQFSFQGAARVEWTSIKGDTDTLGFFDNSYTPVSFSGGVVYKPMAETSLYLNLSHTERAPNPVELFAQGPHDTSATFEFGDPAIGVEKAFSIEGGVKHEDANGNTAAFSIYRTQYSGFIDGFLTGNTYDEDGTFHPDDTGEFRELLYLQNDGNFWGFEAQAHWHVFDFGNGRVGVDAQADYVRATLDSAGDVPRIPPLRFGGGLFYETAETELKLGFMRYEKQNKLGPAETETPGYTFLNASAIFHLYSGPIGDWDIALIGANLTDEKARNHVSFSKDRLLLPGRTFRLVLHFII